MYKELLGKKAFGFPIAASIQELNFRSTPVSAIAPGAVETLAAINRHIPVSIEEADSGGEWFRLESYDFEDDRLFSMLRNSWPLLSGRNLLGFALIHCMGGPDSGVWLHHLNSWEKKSEYLHGCHQIPSWF